jgi:nitrogen fixation protein FixH
MCSRLNIRTSLGSLLFLLLSVSIGLLLQCQGAHASYVENNLISDSVFRDYSPLDLNTVSKIQAFLDSKGGRIASYSPLYSDRDGRNVSAAQIIYEAAQDFGINPKVIMATMQKEESLITDPDPSSFQINYAMGYGCFDATGCGGNYGFFNQVNNATWQLRMNFERVSGNTTWGNTATKTYNYICNGPTRYYSAALRTGNNVTFYDDNGTAYKTFRLANAATSSLYCYTPHAYPGSASKYYSGSYNFVASFEQWFGSTQASISTSELSITKDATGQIFTGQPTNISFTIKNLTKSNFTFKYLGVAIRGPSGENLDPGWASNVTLSPGATYEYKTSRTLTAEGAYQIYISSYADQDSDWRTCYPGEGQPGCLDPITAQIPVQITATPVIKKASNGQVIDYLRPGQAFTISYTIKNASESYSVNPGLIMIAGRTMSGVSRDLHMSNPGTLSPGQSYTYTDGNTYNDPLGTNYRFYVSSTKDNGKTFEEVKLQPADSSAKQEIQTSIRPMVSISQGITTNDSLVVGAKNNISFKITNYGDTPVNLGRVGVTVRGPNGENKDPKWELVDNLSGEYTYSASFTPMAAGKWTISYTSSSADYSKWDANTPLSDTSTIKRSVTVNAIDTTVLSQGPQLDVSQPHLGQVSHVSMQVKTQSEVPVNLGRVGVTVRGPNGENKDPKWELVDNLSFSNEATPSGVYTYQANFNPISIGLWSIGYMRANSGYTIWDNISPRSENNTVSRSITVNVLPQATITSGASITGTALGVRQASFTVTNFGSTSIDLGLMGMAVRDPSGANRDKLWQDFDLAANSSKTQTVDVNLDKAGKWTFAIVSYKNGVWSQYAPVAESASVQRVLVVDAK